MMIWFLRDSQEKLARRILIASAAIPTACDRP